MMKYVISVIYLVQALAFHSPQAFSEEKQPPKLNKEQKKALSQAMMDAYIRYWNENMKSGADADSVLFPKLKDHDRKEIRDGYASMGPAPRLSRKDDTIILKFEKSELKFKWPDLNTNQIFVDNVAWVFDPSAPVMPQMKGFNDKLKSALRQQKTGAIDFQLFPQAHAAIFLPIIAACVASQACTWISIAAAGAIIGTWGGKLAGGLWDIVSDTSCWSAFSFGFKPWNSIGWCRPWKTERDDWAKKAAATTTQPKDPNTRWVAGNPMCPPNEKGVGEIFDAFMAEVKKKPDGTWPDQPERWHRVLGKTKDDNLTEGLIFPSHVTPSFEKANEASVQFTFTKDVKEPILEAVRFRKPDGKYVTILNTDTLSDIPPEYREEYPRVKTMIEAINNWSKMCRTIAQAAKVMPRTVEEASKVMQEQGAREPNLPTQTNPPPAASP